MHQRMAVLLVAVTVAMASTTMWLAAQQPQRGATNQIAIDADDIAGVVDERSRTRSGRVGDRGNLRHADQAPQDRRDRRPGSVPAARSAGQSDLQRLGSRLWPRRLGASSLDARTETRSRPSVLRRTLARRPASIPANYWYSLIDIPAENEFPGTGRRATASRRRCGRSITGSIRSRRTATSAISWATRPTREIPKALGTFASTVAAWDAAYRPARTARA